MDLQKLEAALSTMELTARALRADLEQQESAITRQREALNVLTGVVVECRQLLAAEYPLPPLANDAQRKEWKQPWASRSNMQLFEDNPHIIPRRGFYGYHTSSRCGTLGGATVVQPEDGLAFFEQNRHVWKYCDVCASRGQQWD